MEAKFKKLPGNDSLKLESVSFKSDAKSPYIRIIFRFKGAKGSDIARKYIASKERMQIGDNLLVKGDILEYFDFYDTSIFDNLKG